MSLPEWLRGCPVPPVHLRAILKWLDEAGYVIMDSSCLDHAHPAKARDHPVRVEILCGYKGRTERIGCATCCERCECCEGACDSLYPADPDTPHDNVCYKCFAGDRSCEHNEVEED